MIRTKRGQDLTVTASLFVLTLISRIPFRSQVLYHWDSVNFAFGIQEFDVLQEQPHPPGYIVYIWLCRLADLLFQDAQVTMTWISIVASALSVVALFHLGRSMFDRRTGLIAALFLAATPLFWFYGEIALPHSVDTLMIIVSAWCLFKTMRGDLRSLFPAIALVAIAGGIRQQTLIFLSPMLIYSLRKVGWKRFIAAGLVGSVICLGWFIPLMVQSEGISRYLWYMGEFSRRFQSSTSILMGAGLQGVIRNARRLIMYTLYGWNLLLFPTIGYLAWRAWKKRLPQQWETFGFIFLWICPSLGFYTTIHMGQQGLVFVFLPALILVGAHALVQLLGNRILWLSTIAALLILAIAAFFCLMPEYPLGKGSLRLLTRDTLVNSDHYYQDRFNVIQEHFPAESTAILAANWHHVEYYLPVYALLPIDVYPEGDLGSDLLDGSVEDTVKVTAEDLGLSHAGDKINIVIFDEKLNLLNESPHLAQSVVLENGGEMRFFALEPDQALYYGKTFQMAPY